MQHFHYVGWPDYGAPTTTDSIITLVKAVRNLVAAEKENVKVLVHCAAGVGRTGTFIALYQLMEMLDEKVIQYKRGRSSTSINESELGEITIDIFDTVFKLRKQRCSMVCTLRYLIDTIYFILKIYEYMKYRRVTTLFFL